jgi:hypothetical protein
MALAVSDVGVQRLDGAPLEIGCMDESGRACATG